MNIHSYIIENSDIKLDPISLWVPWKPLLGPLEGFIGCREADSHYRTVLCTKKTKTAPAAV